VLSVEEFKLTLKSVVTNEYTGLYTKKMKELFAKSSDDGKADSLFFIVKITKRNSLKYHRDYYVNVSNSKILRKLF